MVGGGGEVVLGPAAHGQQAEQADQRDHHAPALQRDLEPGADDLGGDAQHRDGQGVDGGLLEQPVELAPDAGRLGRAEGDRVPAPQVGVDDDDVGRRDRQGEQPHRRAHQHGPGEQGDLQEAHAGRSERDHRRGQVHRPGQQRGDDQQGAQKGQGHGVALGAGDAVHRPPAAAREHRRHHDQRPDQPRPERGLGRPGEGQPGRPQPARHHRHGQAQEQRHHHQQRQRGPVQGPHLEPGVEAAEHLVGGGGVEALQPGQHPDDGHAYREHQRDGHEGAADGAAVVGRHRSGESGRSGAGGGLLNGDRGGVCHRHRWQDGTQPRPADRRRARRRLKTGAASAGGTGLTTGTG